MKKLILSNKEEVLEIEIMSRKHNRKIKTVAKNKTSRKVNENFKAVATENFVLRRTETGNWREKVENFCQTIHLIVLEIFLLILLILEIIIFLKWIIYAH